MSTGNNSDAKGDTPAKPATAEIKEKSTVEKPADTVKKSIKKVANKKKTSTKKTRSKKAIKKKAVKTKMASAIENEKSEALTVKAPENLIVSGNHTKEEEQLVAKPMNNNGYKESISKRTPVDKTQIRADVQRSLIEEKKPLRADYIFFMIVFVIAMIMLISFLRRDIQTASQPDSVAATAPASQEKNIAVPKSIVDESSPTSEQLPTEQPLQHKNPTQAGMNSEQNDVIVPINISATQLVAGDNMDSLQLEALRTLFASGGWGVGRDTGGNLVLAPGAGNTTVKRTHGTTIFNQRQLVELASLLRPLGWAVRLDSTDNLILAPGVEATSATGRQSESALTSKETEFTDIDSLLELRGWKLGTDHTGATILLPYNASQ